MIKCDTIECRYNVVQYYTILHSAQQWQKKNMHQNEQSQNWHHTSPSRASYGVSILLILEKIDRVITAPHGIYLS